MNLDLSVQRNSNSRLRSRVSYVARLAIDKNLTHQNYLFFDDCFNDLSNESWIMSHGLVSVRLYTCMFKHFDLICIISNSITQTLYAFSFLSSNVIFAFELDFSHHPLRFYLFMWRSVTREYQLHF